MEYSLAQLIDAYLTYIEVEKNCSGTTVRNYTHWLRRFSRWSNIHGINAPTRITPEAVKQYTSYIRRLTGDKQMQKNTVNYHLIALRSFLSYLNNRGIAAMPKHKVVLSRTVPREREVPLDESEARQLIAASACSTESLKIKRRDTALLALLVHTDLRVSEVAALLRSDIRLHRKECVHRRGAAYLAQQLPRTACEALREYLEARKDSYPALFIRYDRTADTKSPQSMNKRSLSHRSIQRIVSRYSLRAGIQKAITPEVLRRTTLTDR